MHRDIGEPHHSDQHRGAAGGGVVMASDVMWGLGGGGGKWSQAQIGRRRREMAKEVCAMSYPSVSVGCSTSKSSKLLLLPPTLAGCRQPSAKRRYAHWNKLKELMCPHINVFI